MIDVVHHQFVGEGERIAFGHAIRHHDITRRIDQDRLRQGRGIGHVRVGINRRVDVGGHTSYPLGWKRVNDARRMTPGA